MRVICGEKELQKDWPELITMKEKGYPIKNANFYVKYINNKPVGHICYKDMGKWYFIGNSYVKKEYRGQGIYEELMLNRNNLLNGKTKIAILIPIENSELDRLEDRISKRNYTKINSFLDLYGTMSFIHYMRFRKYNMWRVD
tara:strand:- start:1046 stop:1471 length:426 start_codon:yes stop_codon:yes gene_type:complete